MVLDFDFNDFNEKNDKKLMEFLIFLQQLQEQHDFFLYKRATNPIKNL